jgi:hypothetical protein
VTAFITPSRYLRDIASAAGVAERFDFYDEMQLELEERRSAPGPGIPDLEAPVLSRVMAG